MKKVFLSLAVIFSVALVSCGGHKAEEENQAEVNGEEVVADAAVVSDTLPNDSVVNDTVIAVAAEEAPAETPAQ